MSLATRPHPRAPTPDGAAARVPVAALAVIGAGVAAALHLGKLPPAVPALQQALGIGLVEAGFLLSLVQVAGMTLGLLAGLVADSIGLRRCMLLGLGILTLAGAAGALAGQGPGAVPALLALRALEGVGFLLAVMPAPGLIRSLVPAGAEKAAMGLWGAYMPFGVALALLAGPMVIAVAGWQGWWWAAVLISCVAWAGLAALVPPDRRRAGAPGAGDAATVPPLARLSRTLRAPGPWAAALAFGVYSSQWMAVIGFLPAIYVDAGVPATWTALLTALASAVNIAGNVVGGRLSQRGVPPARLLRLGFGAMALGGVAAFAQWGQGADAIALPAALRYFAVCLFSLGGGMVPATLFMLALRVAPGPQTASTTVGLMQQASSLGQFLAPPAVAWLAHRVGGWHWTWAFTLACSLAGILLAGRLAGFANAPRAAQEGRP